MRAFCSCFNEHLAPPILEWASLQMDTEYLRLQHIFRHAGASSGSAGSGLLSRTVWHHFVSHAASGMVRSGTHQTKTDLLRDALGGVFLHLQAGLCASCALAQLQCAAARGAPQPA